MRVTTEAGRRAAIAKSVRFIMAAAEANTKEEMERDLRTLNDADREFSVEIADALITLVDALLEPIRKDLEKLDKPQHVVDSGAI